MENLDNRIARLALQPGDVIVYRTAQKISADATARIEAQFVDFIKAGHKILVLSGGDDIAAVTPGGSAPAAPAVAERHDLYDHIGVIRVRKSDLDALPDWLQQMMAQIVVLRVEFKAEFDAYDFVALCPGFHAVMSRNSILMAYHPVVDSDRFLRFENGYFA